MIGSLERGRQSAIDTQRGGEEIGLLRAQRLAIEQQVPSGSEPIITPVVDGKSLHRACGFTKALGGPESENYSLDQNIQAMFCIMYAHGVYETAVLSAGFAARHGSVQFCQPKETDRYRSH